MQNNSGNPIRQINPPELGKPLGYSQVVDVRAGRIIFIAGPNSARRGWQIGRQEQFCRANRAGFQKLGRGASVGGLHSGEFSQDDCFLAGHG
jgi:hypothetical protein